MTPDEARSLLLTTASLEREGIPASRVRSMASGGEIVAVHRGRYVRSDRWDAAYRESRHLLSVVAADAFRRSDDAVFAFASAAVVHGLPLYRHQAGAPHICTPHADGIVRRGRALRRHEIAIADADRVVVGGIPVTSLQRTVYDLIRTTSRETALACADAALRSVAWDDGRLTYDDAAAETWRSGLKGRIARNAGARGIRQARWIADFAEGRAQLPGESTSRLYLADLGFARPRLQVPFPGPNGAVYRIDFGLDDVRAWGEFDGMGKYLDTEMLGTTSSRKALQDEKEREDWIRGRSQWRFARWGSAHIATARALGSRLASFGIAPAR
ncbi:hypothetical protein [Microbacterium sp. cf046]|uniref:hypothetical protein n=1 Tax=Microbacterium sp. cf046 TaxID=1761803 RepID=UPI001113C1CC|nr:hypothetical protein [Microbacterium sp. cf046]